MSRVPVPSITGPAARNRVTAFLARCLRGLTWRLFAVFCTILAVYSLRMMIMLSTVLTGTESIPWLSLFLLAFGRALLRFTPMLLLVIITGNLAPKALPRRITALAIAVVLGATIGILLVHLVEPPEFASFLDSLSSGNLFDVWFGFCVLGGLGAAIYLFVARDAEASAALHEVEVGRVALDKQMTEARLQVMQAQIEPHFLFNTLANVRRLYQTDAVAGQAMLRHLSRYLSAALPRMREPGTTLGREAELTRAYLSVQQIRMGRRLAFEIDVPEALQEASVPPMMLATLAENAIKHGLGPLPEGGFLRISARADDNQLRLTVADTGRGFNVSSGTGVGLANIQARLAALYGGAARLLLTENAPRGVSATIELPFSTVAPTPAAGLATA